MARNNDADELSFVATRPSPCVRTSLWIWHNRALVLSKLGKFEEAHHLVSDPIALQNLYLKLKGDSRFQAHIIFMQSISLIKVLTKINKNGLQPEILAMSEEITADNDLETLVLKEIEEQRNKGENKLSIELIDVALDGRTSPGYITTSFSIEKNQRIEEAIAIWRTYQITTKATTLNLTEHGKTSAAIHQAETAQATDSKERAIEILTDALLAEADCTHIEETLKAMYRKKRINDCTTEKHGPIENYLDELMLNQTFLKRAEEVYTNTKQTNQSNEDHLTKE